MSRGALGSCEVVIALLAVCQLLVCDVVSASPKRKPSPSAGLIQRFAGPAGASSAEPRLSTLPGGGLLLSWLEGDPAGSHRLRCAVLQNGRWGASHTVSEGDSFFVNWADFPSVQPLGRDGLVAHWLWRTGADTYAYDVRISVSPDGGRTWSRPKRLHRDASATEHGFVSLAPHEKGARAVWLDGHNFEHAGHGEGAGPDMALHTAEIALDGTVSGEQELDGRTCDCCQTATIATAAGALVAYRDRSQDEIRDISLVRLEGAEWSKPYPLAGDRWKIAGCPVNGPAMDAKDNQVAVAWFTAAADSPRVLVAFSGDGGRTFTDPIRIDAGQALGRAGVTLLGDGNALVTWLENSASGAARIVVRRVRRSGELGTANTVANTAAARASGFPQIATVGDAVYFAWTETGTRSQIRLARGILRSLVQ